MPALHAYAPNLAKSGRLLDAFPDSFA